MESPPGPVSAAFRVCVVLSLLVMSLLFWSAGRHASVIVDGTRYHYLDDDQMISMRYARNLAEGHGLVWNAGERVEGYTNFGWTLVMAGVHALGASDARAALWVRCINWGLACGVLLLTAQLLVRLGLGRAHAAIGALLTLALAYDFLFWAINGFETTLLTAVFLLAVLRAWDDGQAKTFRASTCLLAGLLPLIRSDAIDLTVAVVLTAALLGARRRWWLVGVALLPLLGHEAFRLSYYGEWLPNTYYLKVAGRPGRFIAGLGNIKGFVATYTAAAVLAAAAFVWSPDRRVRVTALAIGLGFVRLSQVGPDIFAGFRFLAPYLPMLLVAAVAGVARISAASPLALATTTALLVLGTVFNNGISGSGRFAELVSLNGLPSENTVAGLVVRENTAESARTVVAAAGCFAYFARRPAIDLLGKNDPHVARVRAAAGGATGHDRFDVDWSLRDRPDIVVSFGSLLLATHAPLLLEASKAERARDYGAALLLNATFVREYLDHPVLVPLLTRNNAVFVHQGSPEIARLDRWRVPAIDQP